MSSCNEKKYQDMIHAYEMGMLSENDERDFEIHLLDCQYCCEEIKNFEQQTAFIKNDSDFKKIADNYSAETKVQTSENRKKISSFYFKISIAAAAVLIFLLLKPWSITIDTTQEAIATENKLVIFPFHNIIDKSDPDNLGEIIANLLLTDLAESNYLKVNSSLQLFDMMRIEDVDNQPVNDKLSLEIAKNSNAKWMIDGSILQVKPSYILSAKIIDVATGVILTTEKINGVIGQDIFSLVDQLTKEIKSDLELPLEAINEVDYNIAEVTTHSTEAYQSYIQGLKCYNKFYFDEAEEFFKKALEHDSTFAMAYFYLYQFTSDGSIDSALKYSNKLGHREKQLILSLKATRDGNYNNAIEMLQKLLEKNPNDKEILMQLGIRYYEQSRFSEALTLLNKIIEIDPYNKSAYNMLTYSYSMMNDFENAVLSINKYIEIAPFEANPYDTRGDLYRNFGQIDKAIESYQKAAKINPKFYNPMYYLGYLYLYKGNIQKADSCFNALPAINAKSAASSLPSLKSYIAIREGKFNKAYEYIDKAINEHIKENKSFSNQSYLYLLRATIYENQNLYSQAIQDVEKAIRTYKIAYPESVVTFRYYLVHLYNKNNEFSKVDSLVAELEQYADSGKLAEFSYWFSVGSVQFRKGNYPNAIESFRKSVENLKNKSDVGYFNGHYLLARAYQENNQLSEAISTYEKLSNIYTTNRMYWGIWDIKMHYYLGRAYEDSNWKDKAVKEYQILINYWENADIKLDIVDDAQSRLNRLKQSKA